jgi:hypothetical protein
MLKLLKNIFVGQKGWIPVLLCLQCCFVIGHYVIELLISRALARAGKKVFAQLA